MNLDDPKLTAFALNELDEPEKSAMAQAVATSTEAQRVVDETREFAQSLRLEYAADLQNEALPERAPPTLTDIHDDPWFWAIARPLSIAALLAVCVVIAGIAFFHRVNFHVATFEPGAVSTGAPAEESTTSQTPELEGQLEMPPPPPAAPSATTEAYVASAAQPTSSAVETMPKDYAKRLATGSTAARSKSSFMFAGRFGGSGGQPAPLSGLKEQVESYSDIRTPSAPFSTAAYGHFEENPFLDATANPLSTFSIDVDTASYSNIRRFINDGSLPPKDAVRVEEMINYFNYDYPAPTDGKPFAVHIDVMGCPWAESHRLVRIGLKGKEVAADKRGPSNLVFLLDVSGSMTPPERLPLVKQAMRLMVDKFTENDRVAIVVYAGASGVALPSTTGDQKEKILTAIESLEPGGSTNGAEGIQLAYDVARKNFVKGGVNRVILATDGDFNVGVTDEGDLVRLIQKEARSGVFLSVLGVGTDNLKDSTMQKLADKGNGNYAYLDSLDEARKVLVQQMNGTLVTIAKDVKVQVEFNPARVASYRLIGYEKRILRKEDFNNDKVDAGEIGAGHAVTALYEVVPVGGSENPAASIPPVDPLKYQKQPDSGKAGSQQQHEMLTVKLRYKEPDGDKSRLIEQALTDTAAKFAQANPNLKFAAAVAEFGMILRDSDYKGNGTLGAVLEWAQEGKGTDANGYRAGFIELVRKAQELKKG